jgi:hypothetical protein
MDSIYKKKYIKYKLKYINLQKGGTINKLLSQYTACLERNNYDSSKCTQFSTNLDNTISKQQYKLDKELATQTNEIHKMSKDTDAYMNIIGRPFRNDISDEEIDTLMNDVSDMNTYDIMKKLPSVPKQELGVKKSVVVPPQIKQPSTIPPQIKEHVCNECSSCIRNAYENDKETITKCYEICTECNVTQHEMTKSNNFIKHNINILQKKIEEEQKNIILSNKKIDKYKMELLYYKKK